MAKSPKGWYPSTEKPAAPKVSTELKEEILQKATQFVETEFKPKYIQAPPEPDEFQCNYIVDIFCKWYRHYFYFCSKYACPHENAITPFFESKFARLEYTATGQFNLSYFLHTDKWFEVYTDLSFEQCLESIKSDPIFHP
jgi:hypothetical protein